MWRVVYRPDALKALRRLDRRLAARIIGKVSELAKDPTPPTTTSNGLKGTDGYRLRVGNWRVVYTLQNDALVVTVIRIAPRGSVYE